jgi:adenylate cyclase
MTAATVCRACGSGPRDGAWICDACGSVIAPATEHAEYQQVRVLFGDVVHSIDIAAAVGAERLREIMTELVEHSAAVERRYGGTVDEWAEAMI